MTNHSPSIAQNDARDAKPQLQPEHHVSGPWRVDPYSPTRIEAPNAPKGSMFIAEARGWGHLTGRAHGALALDDDVARGIQDANARLIAAAPDHALVCWAMCVQDACWEEWGGGRGEFVFAGLRHATTLDEFGCPVLTDHLRALFSALSHQPPRAPDEPGDRAREAGKSLPEGDQ